MAPARRAARIASRRCDAQDAGEGQVNTFEGPQRSGIQPDRRGAERFDHLVGALVALSPLTDAAVDDFLQVIGARQQPDVLRADTRARVALDQHAEQLSHLIHIVPRLPLRGRSGEDVVDQLAGRGERVERARRDPPPIALLTDDAEVAQLQTPLVADEDVERREVAVQHLAAMQFAEDLEKPGDLPAGGRFRPAATGAMQEGAQVAVRREFERQAVEDPPIAEAGRINGNMSNTPIARGWPSSSCPK